MRLRDQIAEALKDGPLNIIELCCRLQQMAGIPELTRKDLNGGYNRPPEDLAGPCAQRATANLAETIQKRYELLSDNGFTLTNLLRVLTEDERFECVVENMQVRVDDGDGGRAKRTIQVRKWRNAL